MVDNALVDDILGELNNNSEVISSVVVSRSGMHIAGEAPDGVHLETFVKVADDWRKKERQIKNFGY